MKGLKQMLKTIGNTCESACKVAKNGGFGVFSDILRGGGIDPAAFSPLSPRAAVSGCRPLAAF